MMVYRGFSLVQNLTIRIEPQPRKYGSDHHVTHGTELIEGNRSERKKKEEKRVGQAVRRTGNFDTLSAKQRNHRSKQRREARRA